MCRVSWWFMLLLLNAHRGGRRWLRKQAIKQVRPAGLNGLNLQRIAVFVADAIADIFFVFAVQHIHHLIFRDVPYEVNPSCAVCLFKFLLVHCPAPSFVCMSTY